MAPPLPNSAHTETSSYLQNLAVPREKGGSILPPTDLHKRLKTARYRGVHVRG